MTRKVTEQDLRMPEFRDAKLEDLEFRDDGKLVRKDRWETGVYQIAAKVGMSSRKGFEISEVEYAVSQLVSRQRIVAQQAARAGRGLTEVLAGFAPDTDPVMQAKLRSAQELLIGIDMLIGGRGDEEEPLG